jgi:hypothetical protein
MDLSACTAESSAKMGTQKAAATCDENPEIGDIEIGLGNVNHYFFVFGSSSRKCADAGFGRRPRMLGHFEIYQAIDRKM